MTGRSKIEWTGRTWNPVTGCAKISPGCDHCYAERFAERFRGVPGHPYEVGFDVTLRPERLDHPARWRKPQTVFVNSMSDLFHREVPDDYVRRVFDTMAATPRHTFQVLTKRSGRMRRFMRREYGNGRPPPGNVWMGTSVEDGTHQVRARHLAETPAEIRFLSIEPLIGRLTRLDLKGIDWVIVGGESGPGARLMKRIWVVEIRDWCAEQGVPFFFKQWGGRWPKQHGRRLDDRTHDAMPGQSAENTR